MKKLLACLVASLVAVLALSGCGTGNTAVLDPPSAATSAPLNGSSGAPSNGSSDASSDGSSGASGGTTSAAGSDLAPDSPTTDLRTVRVSELPPEALRTLQLIASGGPFPYSKDGSTFSNREGILPREPKGFYREYTVETPGSDDRGARRIVGGRDGSRFYTSDHYSSFREVVSG